jgi:ribulose 1,5-bisphosphate carboxylase large subunit-like protein
MILGTLADPVAPWALVVAVIGFVVSAAAGIYSTRTARKTAQESAQVAAWAAIVQALQGEVDRLHARVAELENGKNSHD